MRKLGILAAAVAVLAACATPASAEGESPQQMDFANADPERACKLINDSEFKFAIYYGSGQTGSWRTIGFNVYDFASVQASWDLKYHPLWFCGTGAGTPPRGYSQEIKNNAASGDNWHYKYWARIHYNRGYGGPRDELAPLNDTQYRFNYVYNENASFSWG
ncbi:hypothetical protein ABZ766_13400 [Streptomyces sp. NPDC006670]|uniref:hypothetical protein n=1 Tax=Streptomyces sp. NPDC006670 TaxID=3154476 RepID=UPI0033FA8F7E